MKETIKFPLYLFVILSIVFGAHIGILAYFKEPLFGNLIIEGYVVNYIIAVVTYYLLSFVKSFAGGSLGYLFFAASGVKALVFLMAFRPEYKSDGDMERIEFFAFFIPYLVCLAYEVLALVRALNNEEPSSTEQ